MNISILIVYFYLPSFSSPLSPFVACDTIIIIGRNPSLIVFYRFFYSFTAVQFTSNFDVWRKRHNFWICNTCFDRNFCHLQLINVQRVYKALEVEFIVSKQMLIMINGDNACYVGETCQHFSTRVREHLVSDRASHVFKASARFCTLSRFVFSG